MSSSWLLQKFIKNPKLLKAAVYGANDGIVTTFAVVAGVAGAGLASKIIIILGISNMIADGVSMGLGDFLGERSERKLRARQGETAANHDEVWKTGFTTFLAFVLAGTFPLLPYFIQSLGVELPNAFSFSILTTACVLFIVGSVRSIFTGTSWIREGLEMLFVGTIAASVAFFLGASVEQLLR